MPSLPTHAMVALALGQAAPTESRRDWRFWAAAIGCSVLPDFDVIGFGFGIRYGDVWGHRGMTHSLLFAVLLGCVSAAILGGDKVQILCNSILLSLITATHGFLDAMTNGGLGIAFFSPLDTTRYFFSWRPIQVSPIGLGWFFTPLGISVLLNEALYVWLPAMIAGIALFTWRKLRLQEQPTKR
jgi:inner membrane protein